MKRKRENGDDDSDDEEASFGRQILPVANLPGDFADEPMDGMQYLFLVRRDAKKLPHITRVPNPYALPELQPPKPDSSLSEPSKPPAIHVPSQEWRETFEYRFQAFRKNFDQPTIHIGTAKPNTRHPMPDKKDRDMWWAFLCGKPPSEWIPRKKGGKKHKNKPFQQQQQQAEASTSGYSQPARAWIAEDSVQDYDSAGLNYTNDDEGEVEEALTLDPTESLPSPIHTPMAVDNFDPSDPASSTSLCVSEPLQLEPREPTTKILKLIDERTALHLLMYFTHWINLHLQSADRTAYVPTQSHARWMFSLLSRIDEYVSADDMNLLRNLGRACIRLMQNLKQSEQNTLSDPRRGVVQVDGNSPPQEKMSEHSCWIILAIITGVWKQHDLWDDAQQALSST